MTTLALVATACGVVAALVVVVRRATVRSTTSVGYGSANVSREWLMRHQSKDRS